MRQRNHQSRFPNINKDIIYYYEIEGEEKTAHALVRLPFQS